jgi:hypothetical protein
VHYIPLAHLLHQQAGSSSTATHHSFGLHSSVRDIPSIQPSLIAIVTIQFVIPYQKWASRFGQNSKMVDFQTRLDMKSRPVRQSEQDDS